MTGAAPNRGGARFLGDLRASVAVAVVGAELPLRLMVLTASRQNTTRW